MPTPAENLRTALANVCQRLAEITASPQPSYSVAGRSYSFTEYFEALCRQRAELKRAVQDEDSPFLVVSRGRA